MALRPESAPHNHNTTSITSRSSSDNHHGLHRKSSFFKLSRRNKTQSLFPPKPPSLNGTGPSSGNVSIAPSDAASLPPFQSALNPADLARHPSSASVHSARSSPPSAAPFVPLPFRTRSGTTTSAPNHGHAHFLDSSGRNSTASTTLGRNSMAAIRSFTSRRLRTSDAHSTRHGTPTSGQARASTATSFALSRETLVIPDRDDGETPQKYFARIEKDYSKRTMALALSKSNDSFSHDVLRSLARTFKFYEEPIDMSLRKFLWDIPLTGEAQQIDRVLSAFSERYHECNPHIFASADEANYVAFSLIILHSDLYNPQNKTKMTRPDYQKNTRDVQIPPEILGYFYDNIAYTEFIHEDADNDDVDGRKSSKSAYKKVRRVKARLAAPEHTKPSKHKAVDPYDVILDDRVGYDNLKQSLKNELNMDDTLAYLTSHQRFDIPMLRAGFIRFGTLQVVSERSRPDAFAAQSTINNPNEAQQGVVSIKVAKVGIVWRKSAKRRKTRSPWQEWGVILTASQLFFHRDLSWIKNLMGQAEVHAKGPHAESAVVFKPPLTQLAYDGSLATQDLVALQDTSYKRHKHAFLVARRPIIASDHGQDFEETLLAENDAEMQDWMAKINFASTFKSANIRMHPAPRARRPSNANDAHASTAADPGDLAIRSQQTKAKLSLIEEQAKLHVKKLEDTLRAGRHLEILSPFMSKSRGELLAYGARLAHNIRWNRFDVLRLKCHREILFKDLQADETTTSSGFQARSHTSKYESGIPNKGPRIDIVAPSPLASEHPPTPPATDGDHADRDKDSYDDDYLESIDEAFATPPDTLAALEGHTLPVRVNAPPSASTSAPASAPPTSHASTGPPLDPPPSRASVASTASLGAGRPSSATSNHSVAMPLPSEGDQSLARRPGSFTVHGKKASVVTLGDEWARVPAEERLRARKLESTGPNPSSTGASPA